MGSFVTFTVLCCMLHAVSSKMNILFLVSDDMRPEINAFQGSDFPSPIHPKMVTPNLDALISRSLVLKRAYVQQAVCSPSRTSLLTGRRPDTTHVYDLVKYFRKVGGNYTTIPEYFKHKGYVTAGMGKIFHPGTASNNDDPPSWTEPYFHAPNAQYWSERNASWIAVPEKEETDKPLPDTQIADHAIEWLHKLAPKAETGEQPFFLGVGFHKPHLPFMFPERFLKLYPKSDIRLPDNGYAPVDMPEIAWSSYGELRSYADITALHASGAPNTTLPANVVRDLRRAYYSALSYTDEMIGRVVDSLEKLGLGKNTIISFWGDHGWQLGEHGEWCKHTNFELATHAPMLVHIPGRTDSGIEVEKLTEYVDLFPTLVQAAGFQPLDTCPMNSTQVELCTEGNSLMPLIEDPTGTPWKKAAFSQYPREGSKYMGYTVRTDQYRYTEWVRFSGAPEYKPEWKLNKGTELYDHYTDPEENHNIASRKDMADVTANLQKILHAGWRG